MWGWSHAALVSFVYDGGSTDVLFAGGRAHEPTSLCLPRARLVFSHPPRQACIDWMMALGTRLARLYALIEYLWPSDRVAAYYAAHPPQPRGGGSGVKHAYDEADDGAEVAQPEL